MTTGTRRGLIVSAPASGAGKTVVALALMRALSSGGPVHAAKIGPDYIDPTFHEIAGGSPSVNLDPWAMPKPRLRALASGVGDGNGPLVVEAAMGLFDGAADGTGSAADLAAMLRMPVILVLDAAKTSQSLAAVLRGFATHRRDVRVAGIIANRLASARHSAMVEAALAPVCVELGVAYLGGLPRSEALSLPSRHLGLVPAGEVGAAEAFVQGAAQLATNNLDLQKLERLAKPVLPSTEVPQRIAPLGQRIAVASDAAFCFRYRHMLDDWRAAGAELLPFSPLADEPPDARCDAVFLPGGYPELHVDTIANAERFQAGMGASAEAGAAIYGECGGYMVLGETLVGADGTPRRMLGLLPVVTSFAKRGLSLGYRTLRTLADTPFGGAGMQLSGHEFHHSTIESESGSGRLFEARDATGASCGQLGHIRGRVFGSYAHIIDVRSPANVH